MGYVIVTRRGRCDLCAKNAPYSLQSDLRSMNVHRKHIHLGSIPLVSLLALETCQADRTGKKNSLVEVAAADPPTTNYRNESHLEAKVGLVKSTIIFFEGEESEMGPEVGLYFPKHPDNPHYKAVLEFLLHADSLCLRSGSDHCRQQALRDCEGNTSAKVFHPVQAKTAQNYAVTIAKFIYFCERAPWSGKKAIGASSVRDVLMSVLFETRVSIDQTYVTRYGLEFRLRFGVKV